MGDRCHVIVHVKNSQREKFIELVEQEPDYVDEDTEPGMSTLHYDEVNYGNLTDDDYAKLWTHGVVAEIWNGAGDCYGPMLALVGSGPYMHVDSNEDGLIMIPWPEFSKEKGDNGYPVELNATLKNVMQYVEKRDAFYAEAAAEAKAKADADLGSVDYPDGSEEKGAPQQ